MLSGVSVWSLAGGTPAGHLLMMALLIVGAGGNTRHWSVVGLRSWRNVIGMAPVLKIIIIKPSITPQFPAE